MKASVFTDMQSTSEILTVSITRDKNVYGIHSKSKFSFYFIVYTSNVTKQNMNVMALTFCALHVKRWRDKNKTYQQIKIILLPNCSMHCN